MQSAQGDAAVSVVMPVFNAAKTVARALDSVFTQTVPPREVIVVDDASTDRTRDVLAAYAPRGLKILSHESNAGAAAARNRGAAAASGAWIAFIDSDDLWHPTKLETQLAALVAADRDVQASCTGYRLITPSSEEIVDFAGLAKAIGLDELAGGCTVSPGSTLIVSAACFRAVGPFDASLRRYEDWDWLLRYARKHRLGLVHQTLATVHDDRAGHAAAAIMSLRDVGRKHRAQGTFASAAMRLKFESTLLFERAANCHREGRHVEAVLWTAASLAMCPSRYRRGWASLRRALRDLAG